MILPLGILSLFQLVFVPGLILTRLMKFRGFWINFLLTIGLSPMFNYLFVFATTTLGIYTQTCVLILFTVEIALLLYFYFPMINKNIEQTINLDMIHQFFSEYLKINAHKVGWRKKIANIIYLSVFLLAVGSILIYIKLYGTQTSSIFSAWDAVFSWDRWAVDWYMNRFPRGTYHYPQLMPANWSMTYQFMGDSRIKFFAKAYAGYIEIFILLIIFILGLLKQKLGYFLGVISTSWLQFALGSRGNGYADSPVAFFALLSIAFIILAQDNKDDAKYIIAGAIFAAGAAVTKQAGFWIVVAYPLLVVLLNWNSGKQKLIPILVKMAIINLVIIVPWYVFTQIQIASGLNVSEIQNVTTLGSQGKNIYEVFISAISLFISRLNNRFLPGIISFIVLSLLLGISYKDKFWGKICSFFIIPYTIIWIFFFCYDIRNLNLIIPLIGLVSGMGLQQIIEYDYPENFINRMNLILSLIKEKFRWCVQKLAHLLLSVKLLYLLIFVLLIFLLPLRYSDSYLIEKAIAKQKLIGTTELNQMLYEYYAENGINGKILSNYVFLGFIPVFNEYYMSGNPSSEVFINQMNNDQVGYVLINPDGMSEDVKNYYDQLLDHNKADLIFKYNLYEFIVLCHGVCK
jgi:hypothetical protein